MFTVYCPTHAAKVLIWPSLVDAVRNTDAGIEVLYHCTCGHRGAWLTGARRTAVGASTSVPGMRPTAVQR